jgi:hypothetical protein
MIVFADAKHARFTSENCDDGKTSSQKLSEETIKLVATRFRREEKTRVDYASLIKVLATSIKEFLSTGRNGHLSRPEWLAPSVKDHQAKLGQYNNGAPARN